MKNVRKTIRDLLLWIAEARKSNKSAEISSPFLSGLLNKYLSLRSNERGNWSSFGKQKGSTDDLKAVSQAIIYLNSRELVTLDDLDNALHGLNEKAIPISAEMKKAERRMQVISEIQKAMSDCNKTKATNVSLDALQAEYDKLKSSHAELSRQLAAINEELKPMKDIRRWAGKVISSEQAEIESKPEPNHSITEKMRYYQEKEKEETQGKAKAMEQKALN